MRRTLSGIARPLLPSAIMLTLASQSFAAGFAIIEQGVSGLGNAYAGGAASAEDATTIFFNPAGLTQITNRQMVLAGHIIAPQAEYTDSGNSTDLLGNAMATGGNGGNAGSTAFVPNFYYSMPMDNGMVFGLGINAPFGLKTEYDDNWIGRYHAIESELKTVNINPTIAWKANDQLSLGFGVSAQYIEATLTRALDTGGLCYGAVINDALGMGASQAAAQAAAVASCTTALGANGLLPQQSDGLAKIEGDDWSFGFNFGALYELSDATRVGFAYRSKVKQELEGDADFTIPAGYQAFLTANGSNAFIDTGANASVDLPETFSFSIFHDVNDKLSLMGDITYTKWDRFEELRVTFDNPVQPDSVTPEQWDNSIRVAVGGNYQYSKDVLLKMGIAHDEEPIPNSSFRTPRIPGNDRTWLAFGAQFTNMNNMVIDVGYAHLFVDDTPINHTSASAGTIIGEYENSVDILSAQLTYNFDL